MPAARRRPMVDETTPRTSVMLGMFGMFAAFQWDDLGMFIVAAFSIIDGTMLRTPARLGCSGRSLPPTKRRPDEAT
jgi:hypothetical protein